MAPGKKSRQRVWERSTAELRSRGVKEAKIAIPDEVDETAEEQNLNKFTESTEVKIESCSHFFFHRDTIIITVSQVEKQNI